MPARRLIWCIHCPQVQYPAVLAPTSFHGLRTRPGSLGLGPNIWGSMCTHTYKLSQLLYSYLSQPPPPSLPPPIRSCSCAKHSSSNSFMFVLQQGVINSPIYKICTAIYTHCLIKVVAVIEVNTSLWDEGVIAPQAPHGSPFSLPPALSLSLFWMCI